MEFIFNNQDFLYNIYKYCIFTKTSTNIQLLNHNIYEIYDKYKYNIAKIELDLSNIFNKDIYKDIDIFTNKYDPYKYCINNINIYVSLLLLEYNCINVIYDNLDNLSRFKPGIYLIPLNWNCNPYRKRDSYSYNKICTFYYAYCVLKDKKLNICFIYRKEYNINSFFKISTVNYVQNFMLSDNLGNLRNNFRRFRISVYNFKTNVWEYQLHRLQKEWILPDSLQNIDIYNKVRKNNVIKDDIIYNLFTPIC